MEETYAIPQDEILEKMRFENGWWTKKTISEEFAGMLRRLYFELFMPLVQDQRIKRAVLLIGPRRVGKTVMIHQAIDALLSQDVSARNINFIAVDNSIYIHKSLDKLFDLVRTASGNVEPEGQYVFFDEIQYIKDWEQQLKVLVDSYPKTKFIVSGSAAATLRVKGRESGAGRFHEFILPPLTFQEFLDLRDLGHLLKETTLEYGGRETPFYGAVDIRELNDRFFEYLNFGGYPEVIFSETIRNDMPRYIKNDIVDKVLLRDLPGLFGIRDVHELSRFFAYVAYNSGKEFAYHKMSKESGLEVATLKRYLEYFEAAFLITVVYKIDENAKHFKRITGFKVYLTNTSLRTALFSPIRSTDDEAGNIVETAIFSQWMHRRSKDVKLHYARWKKGGSEGEVDMVMLDSKAFKPAWALEIKWSNRFVDKPRELKSLINFCNQNDLDKAVVTTIDRQTILEMDGVTLYFFPAAVYAYVIGANTIRHQSHFGMP